MEKGRPHYPLAKVISCIEEGRARATTSALSGAAQMGLSFRDILAVVGDLKNQKFFKSMTTYNDHQVWQDVYHVQTSAGEAYLKLTVVDGLLIVSFKEL